MKKIMTLSLVFCFIFLLFVPAQNQVSAASTDGKMIIINKSTNELAYFENSEVNRIFSVGTGKSSELTPEGHFKIVNKIVNRPYYAGNVAGGDPKNPLGNRWLGLNARGTWGTTYAIHGNNNSASIGNYVSLGCIRMHNNEVQWLFDHVSVNTPVIITSSSSSFEAIAKSNGYTVTGKSSTSTTVQGTVLRRGNRSAAVKDLQQQLTKLGYNTNGIDGIFGPGTEKAVRKFQQDKKLTADGIVGAKTWNALGSTPKTSASKSTSKTPVASVSNSILRRGSRGEAVKTLQRELTNKGYNTYGVDGIFGPATEGAVRKLQKNQKILVDGIVGPQTWNLLK